MTRARAKELLPVIQAYAEGKDIQIEMGQGWSTVNEPTFQDQSTKYRIKPEPRVWYARVYGKSDGCCLGHIFERADEAYACSSNQPHEVIKVQEVL